MIQTRNNYDLAVMKGAVGIITRVGYDGSMAIEFTGMSVDIESGSPNMHGLQLAYVLTL